YHVGYADASVDVAVDQARGLGLPEGVAEFFCSVLRVHGHQDQAGQGCAELEYHPFGAVGLPDGQSLAGGEAGEQGGGGLLGFGEEFGVGPAAAGAGPGWPSTRATRSGTSEATRRSSSPTVVLASGVLVSAGQWEVRRGWG